MKIDFISDIHMDSHCYIQATTEQVLRDVEYPNRERVVQFCQGLLKETPGDVLVVAGDLSNLNNYSFAFLKEMVGVYGQGRVMIVPGNHDYYIFDKFNKDFYQGNSFNRIIELMDGCEKLGVVFLNGQIVDVGGIKFTGVGCFYDDYYARLIHFLSPKFIKCRWALVMNDYNHIYVPEGNPFSCKVGKRVDTINFNKFSKYQSDKLSGSYGLADVVVSHVAPTFVHLKPHRKNYTSTFFQFDGRHMVNSADKRKWIFGHTHDNDDFAIGGLEFHCNPLGYRGENHDVFIRSFEL